MKAEFVMLAHVYNPPKHSCNGWLWSEKLDGHRALWVPSTRGESNALIGTEVGVATGLWSRYGKIIHAPDWWLDLLPPICLDGELYNATRSRQQISSIVTRDEPDGRWSEIQFHVFDTPTLEEVSYSRTLYKLGPVGYGLPPTGGAAFITRYETLKKTLKPDGQIRYVEHRDAPLSTIDLDEFITNKVREIVAIGGEGIMLRNPWSRYCCCRTHDLLKVKPRTMSTAIIVGFTEGKGRLKGSVGALVVVDNGVQFELSGMTDLERRPGYLQRGEEVRYEYRALSDSGVPIEAAYKGVVK